MADRLRAVALAVPVGLVLGVASADGWRLGADLVTALVGLQAWWAALPFAVAWRTAPDDPRGGAWVGGLTGFSAIAGYYVWEALAWSLHSAVAQLTRSGGLFWVVGATVGGALFGLLGSVANRRDVEDRGVTGAAVLLLASVPGAEAVLVLWFIRSGHAPDHGGMMLVLAALLALALVVLAWTRSPGRGFVRSVVLAAPVAALCLGLLWLAESRLAYLTL